MATIWKIGDRINGRYEVHKILRGGMGVVYVVYDHKLREAFAAKTFQDEVFEQDPRTADRFQQEALAWINLDAHENVARARLVEAIEGKPLLFLEYVAGGDLGNWIGTPRLIEDLPQVLRFAIQFCDGMAHALSHGIKAHRDIKPANCLITQDKKLKVTDFGIASVFESGPVGRAENRLLAQTGAGAGTPPYMAPEQFDDFNHVDVRADIYSFGVMLFEMATGRWPFSGGSWDEFRHLHQTQPPPLLSSGAEVLNGTIQLCLVKDRARRFAEFGIVRRQLAGVYQRLTGGPAPRPATAEELSAWEWVNKGFSLGNLRRHDDALACYDRALKNNPRYATAWFNKGASYGLLGRHADALAYFDRALEIDPLDASAWLTKGVAFKALGRREDALACCDRALEIDPQYADAWGSKGAHLTELGEHEGALACYDRALKIDRRNAAAWTNMGNTFARVGRPEDALACYARALEIDPRSVNTWSSKGKVLYSLGRREEGLACLDRLLDIDARNASAWYNKGVHFADMGRREDAVACYDRALDADPRYTAAWVNKGVYLADLGRRDDALACYDQALKIDPRCAVAWCNKGASLGVLGRSEDAMAAYDRALEINPRYADAWYKKGATFADTGRFEDALPYYDQALAIEPCWAEAWFGKGAALTSLMRFDDAISCLEQARRFGIANATVQIEALEKVQSTLRR